MAHHLLSFSLLMLANMCSSAQGADAAQNPLLSDLWNHRPLLIIVPDIQHPMLLEIEQALRQASVQTDFQERNMMLYVLTDKTARRDGRRLQPSEAAAILDALKVKTPINPTAILIGLDGGIKYQSTERVDLQTIFTLIDGMPMRQRHRN